MTAVPQAMMARRRLAAISLLAVVVLAVTAAVGVRGGDERSAPGARSAQPSDGDARGSPAGGHDRDGPEDEAGPPNGGSDDRVAPGDATADEEVDDGAEPGDITGDPLAAGSSSPRGTFTVAPGGAPAVGTGPLRTYSVEVEDGIGLDPGTFAAEVDRVLGDPRGWTADGAVSLQRVGPGQAASFRVVLATPETTDALCAPLRTNGIFSCHQGGVAVVNLYRWTEGAAPSGLDLPRYREYVISHEVGHALGHDHVGCPGPGQPAPVMMQQTKGIGACAPNPWPHP